MLLNPYRFSSAGGGDPYWSNVLALLNGTSSEGIVDAKGRSLTRTGTHSIITTDPDFPAGGIYFDGSAANNIRYNSPSAWMNLPGQFSIEFDYKPLGRTSNYPAIIGAYTAYGANGGFTVFDRHQSRPSQFTIAMNGAFPILESGVTLTEGTRYIFQISRGADNYLRFFINGSLQQQLLFTDTVVAHDNFLAIGAGGDNASTYISGIVGRFRVTKDIARNTANYTPTTEPYPTS